MVVAGAGAVVDVAGGALRGGERQEAAGDVLATRLDAQGRGGVDIHDVGDTLAGNTVCRAGDLIDVVGGVEVGIAFHPGRGAGAAPG